MSLYNYTLRVPISNISHITPYPLSACFIVERDGGDLTKGELLQSITIHELADIWGYTQGGFSPSIFTLVNIGIRDYPEHCEIDEIEEVA